MRVAFARWKAARAIRDDASNDAMPTITSRASSNLGKGQIPGQTTDRVNTERYDLGLDMAWELDLFGRIQRNLEATDANQQAIEADLYQLQVTMIADAGITQAFGDLARILLVLEVRQGDLFPQLGAAQLTVGIHQFGDHRHLQLVELSLIHI